MVWSISLPVCVFFSFFSRDLVALLFQRGSFDKESLLLTITVLQITGMSILPLATYYLYWRLVDSFGGTKFLAKLSLVTCFLSVSLLYFLSKNYSLIGLSVAVTVSSFLLMMQSFLTVYFRHLSFDIKTLFKKAFVVLCICLCSGFLTKHFAGFFAQISFSPFSKLIFYNLFHAVFYFGLYALALKSCRFKEFESLALKFSELKAQTQKK